MSGGYRHSFHAGNAGDVLKHSVLAMMVRSITRKPNPFFYFDAHAGAGRFCLTAAHAQRKKEYLSGISRVWKNLNTLPEELEPYIAAIKGINEAYKSQQPEIEQESPIPPEERPPVDYYPGSPWIVSHLKRDEDHMVLTEINTTDYLLLKKEFDPIAKAELPIKTSNISILNDDGYRRVLHFVPPQQKRGLVMFDPPYQFEKEWTKVAAALTQANKLWPWGSIAIWYPVSSRKEVDDFHQTLRNTGIKKILLTELTTEPDSDSKTTLYGSGMVILNPPYLFNKSLEKAVPWLWKVLSDDKKGSYKVTWLTPEQ